VIALSDEGKAPLAFPGMRIGLQGGSFNPPHAGHRAVALEAIARLRLDAVWWVVTPGNPLKDTHGLPPLGQRIALCREVSDHPKIKVTGLEAALGTVYTAKTLAFLVQRFPRVRFVWLMGADNLATIHLWHDWQQIFLTMPVAVLNRPGLRYRALASPAAKTFRNVRLPVEAASLLPDTVPPAWCFLPGPHVPVSSSRLRQARERG
jgi:nicotinate-nucleotide adenylyltransferase